MSKNKMINQQIIINLILVRPSSLHTCWMITNHSALCCCNVCFYIYLHSFFPKTNHPLSFCLFSPVAVSSSAFRCMVFSLALLFIMRHLLFAKCHKIKLLIDEILRKSANLPQKNKPFHQPHIFTQCVRVGGTRGFFSCQ